MALRYLVAAGNGRADAIFSLPQRPLWFTVFDLSMVVLGAVGNVSNAVYAFTRHSPAKRRVADVVGLLLFLTNVGWSVAVVLPAQSAADPQLARHHLVVLCVQLLQLATTLVAYHSQEPSSKAKKA